MQNMLELAGLGGNHTVSGMTKNSMTGGRMKAGRSWERAPGASLQEGKAIALRAEVRIAPNEEGILAIY